jgi:hypothetical protein
LNSDIVYNFEIQQQIKIKFLRNQNISVIFNGYSQIIEQ